MGRQTEGVVSFGEWAKQRRQTLALTQAALAARIGCAVATLQKIEQGARTPSEQMAGLLAEALAIAATNIPAVVAGARSGVAPSFNAPVPILTRVDDLIGRDRQLDALAALITARAHRIVTLTGPGGVGKTALALALMHASQRQFDSGARFVSLAEVQSPALVPNAAIAVLAPDARVADLSALLALLREREQLLVFDNFEHVLAAATIVTQITQAAPRATVLVTSREPLGLPGEHCIAVRPLAPSDARALFLRHAQLADPRWRETQQDGPAIDALCQSFDRLPLAIQLCAARVAVMPPAAMLRRLLTEQGYPRLELAADGLSDLPLRHHSLEDTIRWSYAMLDAGEQRAFQALAVFSGGCDLAAAEAVVGAETPTSTWNALTSLLQKNLLTRTRDDASPRFVLLETLRAFARQAAQKSGAWSALQAAHLRYFDGLAAANQHLTPFNARVQAQEREAPNFYSALAYGWRNDTAAAMRIFRGLIKFWRARMRFADQLAVAREGLAFVREPENMGELHMQAGSACIALERIDEAQAHLLAAGDCLAALPNAPLLWRVRDLQGLLAQRRGDLAESLALHQEALALTKSLNDPLFTARAALHIGRACAMLGRFADAEAAFADAVALLPEKDENQAVLSLLRTLTQQMLEQYASAQASLARGIALTENADLVDIHGGLVLARAGLAYAGGDLAAALQDATRAGQILAALEAGLPARVQADRVHALLLLANGDTTGGLALLRTVIDRMVLSETSVASLAVLSGLATALAQRGKHATAQRLFATVVKKLADETLPQRVFADALPFELRFARRAVETHQRADTAAPLTLVDAAALAMRELV